jgi:predicted  nucleic acid-binding Zn-ribbon protein
MKKGKKMTMGGDNKYNTGEVATLLESLTDGITLIAEQHGEIVKRLDRIDGKLDRIEDGIEKIEVRLDKIEARLDKIEGDVDDIKNDILKIRQDLKRKVSYEEFEKLEKRVIKLERLAIAR